jgi:hypothetical protein
MSIDNRIKESINNSHESSCCFVTQKLENKGNGLIATRKILAGGLKFLYLIYLYIIIYEIFFIYNINI